MNTKTIMCAIKTAFFGLVGFVVVYAMAISPMMDRSARIACHVDTAAAAQQIGENIASQNEDNEELSEQEVVQQINAIVNQQYEAGYVLCLRGKGL